MITILKYMILIIERINVHIQDNAIQKSNFISSGFNYLKGFVVISKKDSRIFSPCWKIYNELLFNKAKQPLFTIGEIQEFKNNKFNEIIEKINSDSWIYGFQENPMVYGIIKSQFCLNYFEKLVFSRLFEADHIYFNNDLIKRETLLVNKMIKKISIAINESILFIHDKFKNDIFKYFFKTKEKANDWKNKKKSLFQWRGKWCVLDEFLADNTKKFKIANHYTSILSRPILSTIFDLKRSVPNFKNYDPSELFTDTKLQSFFDMNINNDSFSFDNSEKIELFDSEKEKNDTKTLKSMIYSINKDFQEFSGNYSILEKEMSSIMKINEKNSNKILFSISDHFVNSYNKVNSNTNVFEVCRVKITDHTGGKLLINNKEIIFIHYYPDKITTEILCDGALFKKKNSLIKDSNFIIIIDIINNLKFIHKRRYYYRKNSLEIFTNDNKSYFFKFSKKDDRDVFWYNINLIFSKLAYQFSNKSLNSTFDFALDAKKNSKLLSKLSEDWSNYKISNFEYLMTLNSLAGRSYNDLSQYPVFPWVINDYSSDVIDLNNKAFYRDLSKPMGMIVKIYNI